MNSEQYAEKIKHTRAEIDDTLHTLEDKLSSRELWEQAVKWGDGAREFSANLSRTVRENPVPAAMMGISLIWLMATTGTGRRFEGDVSGAKSKFQHKYSEVKSNIAGTTSEAGEKMKHFSDDLKHRGEHLKEQSRELKEKLQASSSELSGRPVLLSALGLALGALAAMSLPISRKEEEVVGKTVDEFREKTTEFVGEQMEKGKEAASAAVEAAKEKLGSEKGKWTTEESRSPGHTESSPH